jgi:hypothetical protein
MMMASRITSGNKGEFPVGTSLSAAASSRDTWGGSMMTGRRYGSSRTK